MVNGLRDNFACPQKFTLLELVAQLGTCSSEATMTPLSFGFNIIDRPSIPRKNAQEIVPIDVIEHASLNCRESQQFLLRGLDLTA
jgi:hypothetical protein